MTTWVRHAINPINTLWTLRMTSVCSLGLKSPPKTEKGSRQLHHPKSSSPGDPSLLIKIYLLSYHLSLYDIVCVRGKNYFPHVSHPLTWLTYNEHSHKKGGSLTTGDKRNSKDFLMKKEGINIFIFQSFFFHMVKTILFCVTFRQSIWEWLVCEAGIIGNLRSCSEWPHSPQHQPDPPYLDENYFSVWWTKKFHTQNFLSAFFNWKSHFFSLCEFRIMTMMMVARIFGESLSIISEWANNEY